MKFATLMAVIFVSIFLVNAANASSDITYTAACTVLTKQSNNSTQHYSNIVVEGFPDEAACELMCAVKNGVHRFKQQANLHSIAA